MGGAGTLATSPIPRMARSDLGLAAKGLGTMGSYVIPERLWQHFVPESFLGDALRHDVEADLERGCGTVGAGVAEMASFLLNSGVISATLLPPS